MAVGVRGGAKTVIAFLLRAEAAASFTTADAGAVESRVVRPEVTFTAVPEGGHFSGKVD